MITGNPSLKYKFLIQKTGPSDKYYQTGDMLWYHTYEEAWSGWELVYTYGSSMVKCRRSI